MAKQSLRIRDVARHARVSPATVSRVLTGNATVRADKREQVLAAIEALGYRPNRLASNLRRQQADMIGVVVSDIENPHFTEMVRAVEDAAYLSGHRVLLCNTDENPAKQADYLGVLAEERVVGVIDGQDLVTVYMPGKDVSSHRVKCCVTVFDGSEMVLVSAQGNLEPLLKYAFAQPDLCAQARRLAQR